MDMLLDNIPDCVWARIVNLPLSVRNIEDQVQKTYGEGACSYTWDQEGATSEGDALHGFREWTGGFNDDLLAFIGRRE